MKHSLRFLVVFVGALLLVTGVCAQEVDGSVTAAVTTEAAAQNTSAEAEVMVATDASVTASPTSPQEEVKAKSSQGFWFGLRERLALALTFNPIKKAEKEMEYAEKRLDAAEAVLGSADASAEAKARAEVAMKRAEELIAKAGGRVEALQGSLTVDKEVFLRNIVNRQLRASRILDKIETKLPEEAKAQFVERRERIEARSEATLDSIEQGALGEALKLHAADIKLRVETKAEAMKAYQAERKALMDRVQAGDEAAKAELKTLNEERINALKEVKENFQDRKAEVKEGVKEGEAGARMELRVLNEAGRAVKQEVKERVGEMRDAQDARRASFEAELKVKAAAGDETAKKQLEALQKLDARLDTRDAKLEASAEARKEVWGDPHVDEKDGTRWDRQPAPGKPPVPKEQLQTREARALREAKELQMKAAARKMQIEQEMKVEVR